MFFLLLLLIPRDDEAVAEYVIVYRLFKMRIASMALMW